MTSIRSFEEELRGKIGAIGSDRLCYAAFRESAIVLRSEVTGRPRVGDFGAIWTAGCGPLRPPKRPLSA